MVGVCDGRSIRLVACVRVRAVNVHNDRTGALGDSNDRLGEFLDGGRFDGHDFLRSCVVNSMSYSRLGPDSVTFVLAYLLFLRAVVEVLGQIMVPGCLNLKLRRFHGRNRMPEQEDIS